MTSRANHNSAERRGAISLAVTLMIGLLTAAVALALPSLTRSAPMLARLAASYSLPVMVLAASLSFTIGGIFMKLADGLTRPMPTIALLIFFAVGACLQTLAMRGEELSSIYIIVLGVEAILAFAFGWWFFHEALSPMKVAGVIAIIAGVIALRY